MTLIKPIQLPNGRSTSNLGFGCSGILRVYSGRGRERLLRTAVEEGITHFDVARMYGMGTAEGIVGSSLKSVRDQITIATKFGLPYETSKGLYLHLQSLARALLNRSPALKKLVKKAAPPPAGFAPPPATGRIYSIQEMKQSLDLSLRQLQTDCVDLFFIHEPGRNDRIAEGMSDALRQEQAAERLGAFGLSTQRAELDYFLQARPDICRDAIQYDFSVFASGPESLPVRHPCAGLFGLLSGTLPSLDKYLQENPPFAKAWSARLNLDLKNRDNLGVLILALALVLNPNGFVLFFTSQPRRIRHMARSLRENPFTETDLLAFREAVSQGIHAH